MEYLLNLRGIEDAGRTPAKVNRVCRWLPLAAVDFCHTLGGGDILRQAIHVALHAVARKHVGGEVAVAALRLAKRHRNIKAKRHHRRRERSRSAATRPFLRISVTESSIFRPFAAVMRSCSRFDKRRS